VQRGRRKGADDGFQKCTSQKSQFPSRSLQNEQRKGKQKIITSHAHCRMLTEKESGAQEERGEMNTLQKL
jgi:argininosuccinate lyase